MDILQSVPNVPQKFKVPSHGFGRCPGMHWQDNRSERHPELTQFENLSFPTSAGCLRGFWLYYHTFISTLLHAAVMVPPSNKEDHIFVEWNARGAVSYFPATREQCCILVACRQFIIISLPFFSMPIPLLVVNVQPAEAYKMIVIRSA